MSLQLGPQPAEHPPITDDQATNPDGWVDRHADGLYRYALMRLRSPELAEDAVQETFLDAIRVQSSFTGRSSERTWLIGILRHKIIDRLRKAARDPSSRADFLPDEAVETTFDVRGHWRTGPAHWGPDPSSEMETREFWEVFGGCLSHLPAGLADAFYLREIDDLPGEEIQRILGITPSNFWKRLHRARFLLRQCLESRWFGKTL